jgi:hypothetical protein
MIGTSGRGTTRSYHALRARVASGNLSVVRVQFILLPLVVLAVGCELMSGVSDLEKDPTFNPDAALPEVGGDTGTATGDTATADDTGTMMTTDTGTMMAMDSAMADTKVTTDTKPADTGGCGEPESITYGGHCYFPLKTNLSFTDAKNACVAKGAYLAVIESAAENDAVSAIDNASERWIGLSRAAADPNMKENYKWVNGTAFDAAKFDGWAAGEPNGGDAARLKAADKAWYDREGATTTTAGIHAICEKG